MPDDLIHCPSCNFQLRLPHELYGSPVECPQCHTRFTAPVPAASAAPGSGYEVLGQPPGDYGVVPNPAAAPGIALLIVSILGLLLDLWLVLGVQAIKAQPKIWEDQIERELDRNPSYTPEQRRQLREILSVENVTSYGLTGCGTFLVGNAITALGAVFMIARRGYALAIIGCILALNPVNLPACFLSVPFGIWGLIALMSQSGRRAFR
jgi:hypothetical protein